MIGKLHPLILFLAAIFVIGLAMAVFGVYFVVLGNEARSWPAVEGQVIATQIRAVSDLSHGPKATRSQRERLRQYYPAVTYRWAVDGESYTGSRYRLGTTHEKYREREDAVKAAARYSTGAAVTVYYDPRDPREAVLEKSTSVAVYVPLILGLLMMATGGFSLRHREALRRALAAQA